MRNWLRRVLRVFVDLAVLIGCIACILHISRHRTIDCHWDKTRATCEIESENSLGQVEHETIDGIRSAAYRKGVNVGLVTDAQNHGELALFGTRDVQVPNRDAAARLYGFAFDRDPNRIFISAGVAHPPLITAAFLAGLIVFAFLSARLRRASSHV